MKQRKIRVSAPGKICLAGEWAVLEKGNSLIVAAIDSRVFAEIEESRDNHYYVSIPEFDVSNYQIKINKGRVNFLKKLASQQQKNVVFLKCALETFLSYKSFNTPFLIKTWGKGVAVSGEGKTEKLGFGSSAATVVAVMAGLFKFCGEEINSAQRKEEIYKLSALAHYFAQGKLGSGFDVAASTFGGIGIYQRFDPFWLEQQFVKNHKIKEIIEAKWPSFSFKHLNIPSDLKIIVGWTGKSSSTASMIKKMESWKKNHQPAYYGIISKIGALVEDLIDAWAKGDKQKIIMVFRENEKLLKELGKKSNIDIESEELRILSKIANSAGGAGKLSGAGGGDCGIAIVFDSDQASLIREKWRQNNIIPLNINLAARGVREV